jgi:hypothetical protein
MIPFGQKLTLGILATISLKVNPFRAYAPFPALLPFYECILEVVFCEGIHHRLRFYLGHLSFLKMAAFQFHFQSGKQRKLAGGKESMK